MFEVSLPQLLTVKLFKSHHPILAENSIHLLRCMSTSSFFSPCKPQFGLMDENGREDLSCVK